MKKKKKTRCSYVYYIYRKGKEMMAVLCVFFLSFVLFFFPFFSLLLFVTVDLSSLKLVTQFKLCLLDFSPRRRVSQRCLVGVTWTAPGRLISEDRRAARVGAASARNLYLPGVRRRGVLGAAVLGCN